MIEFAVLALEAAGIFAVLMLILKEIRRLKALISEGEAEHPPERHIKPRKKRANRLTDASKRWLQAKGEVR